jgi:hypothetical protein
MTDEHAETLSRLLDGELIDEGRLREALAQPEASRVLSEWANLRHLLTADLDEPDEDFCEAMRQRLRRPGWRRLLQEHLVPASLAASLVLVGTAFGYSVRWWSEPFQPAGPSPTSPVAATPGTAAPAPAPPPAPATTRASARPVPPAPQTRRPFTEWRDGSQPN